MFYHYNFSCFIIRNDDQMAGMLLKYFKVGKRGPPLPNSSGSLNQQLSSSAIEETNKEVTAVLCDPPKHQPYLKISPEQKAIIARYAANNGIVKAIRQFSKDFPEKSLKESTIRGRKKTYLKELSLWKKAGQDTYDNRKATGKGNWAYTYARGCIG